MLGDKLHLTGVYKCLCTRLFPSLRTVHQKYKGDVKMENIIDEEHENILERSERPNVRESFVANFVVLIAIGNRLPQRLGLFCVTVRSPPCVATK